MTQRGLAFFAAARMLGYENLELEHVSFGTVLGDDGKPFKTRAGGYTRIIHAGNRVGDNAKVAILEIVGKAYQIETDGYTFYSMTAERATKPAVQELFSKLASDEVQHQAFLRSVLKNYHDKGVEAFSMGIVLPDLRAFSDKVFTDRFRDQAEGAAFEMAALSVGMTLEKNAVAYFTGAAGPAEILFLSADNPDTILGDGLRRRRRVKVLARNEGIDKILVLAKVRQYAQLDL